MIKLCQNFAICTLIIMLFFVSVVPFALDDVFAATVGAHVTKINTNFTEPGEASVAYQVCSGNNHLVLPQILIHSDMESKLITMDRNIEPNVCQGGTTILEVENYSSITAVLVTDTPDISVDEKTLQLDSARVAYHGMSNDGQILVEVNSTLPQEDMPLDIVIRFTDELGNPVHHVNFDIKISQQGNALLEQSKLHTHNGKSLLMTPDLDSDASVDIDVVLQGIGLPNEETKWTGPIGEIITFKVIPEFGTVVMTVFLVAIAVTVIASAKFGNLRIGSL